MVKNTIELSKNQIEILYSICNFLTIPQIAKYRKTSRTAVYKTIKLLEKQGLIKKIDRALFEVTELGRERLQTLTTFTNKIRLHNLAFRIKILDSNKNWDMKRNNILFLKTFNKQVDLNNTSYEIFNLGNIKVKTTSKSVIFYMPTTYGSNVEEAFFQSMDMLFEVVPKVENMFKIKLIKDKKTNIDIISQHFSRLNDALAKIYKKEGNKLYITGDDGKVWLIADFSFSTSELEAIHTKKAGEDMEIVHNLFNDLRKNPTTFSEVRELILQEAKVMSGIQQNQLIFDKNMSSHLQVLKELGQEVKGLANAVNSIKSENIRLKQQLNKHNQRTLYDF